MGNPIVHFEIMCADAPAMRDYYSELFGRRVAAGGPGATRPDTRSGS
jgi:predicted enzyme related to lactoylglutathione lyase